MENCRVENCLTLLTICNKQPH